LLFDLIRENPKITNKKQERDDRNKDKFGGSVMIIIP